MTSQIHHELRAVRPTSVRWPPGEPRLRRWMSAVAMLAVATCSARSARPQDADAESDRLFYEGNELMTAGEHGEACAKFAESLSLRRRGGTLLNLALCREANGELVEALLFFEDAREIAQRDGRVARADTAARHIAELRPRLAWLSVKLAPGAETAGLTITVDGVELTRDRWGAEVPKMPGAHTVEAAAPGKRRLVVRVTAAAGGEVTAIEIPALAPLVEEKPSHPPSATRPTGVAPPAEHSLHPDYRAADEDTSLSHAWRPGLLARLDVDPIHPGARLAAGLTFGLGDHVELGVSGLFGRDLGVEPQVTAFVLGRGPWKPFVNAGAPLFFSDGAQAGARGAVGLEWDPNAHFGLLVQMGGAYFPSAPEGIAPAVLLLSLGAQGRL